MIRRKYTIHGKVQGVFFRVSTQREANAIGLTGFVENRDDGSVYCEAEGTKEQVLKLEKWLKVGPEYANVTEIITKDINCEHSTKFEINK